MEQSPIKKSFRKALATFVFSTTGVLIGITALDDVELWKLAASTGIGAVINFAYRWAESVLKESTF